jgi:hypothetical protein
LEVHIHEVRYLPVAVDGQKDGAAAISPVIPILMYEYLALHILQKSEVFNQGLRLENDMFNQMMKAEC